MVADSPKLSPEAGSQASQLGIAQGQDLPGALSAVKSDPKL